MSKMRKKKTELGDAYVPLREKDWACGDCGKPVSGPDKRCGSCAIRAWQATPEAKQKMSQAQLAKWTPELRQKASEKAKIRWSDPEERKRASRSARIRSANPEWRDIVSKRMKKRWKNPEERQILIEAIRNGVQKPEARRKHSQAIRAAWENGKYDRRSLPPNPSNLARRVAEAISQAGFHPELEYWVGGRPFDIYVSKLALLVEIDGEYWHYSKDAIERGQPQRDQEKQKIALSNGFNFIRFRERDIKALGVDCLLQEFVEKNHSTLSRLPSGSPVNADFQYRSDRWK